MIKLNAHRRYDRILWIYMAVIFLLTGCTGDKKTEDQNNQGLKSNESVITLKALTVGSPPESGMDEIYGQLDEMTIRDFNCIIRFDFLPLGDESDDIYQAILGREYDLYCGGPWSYFWDLASKKAFTNLNSMLKNVPDLTSHYSLENLEDLEVNGGLYGIPQYYQVAGGGEGLLYREDLREQWGLPEITDFSSMEQYLYKAQEAYNGKAMITSKNYYTGLWKLLLEENYLQTNDSSYFVTRKDNPYQVVSPYDTEEYKKCLLVAKQWYDDGIVSKGVLGNSRTFLGLDDMSNDQTPLIFNRDFNMVSESYLVHLKKQLPDCRLGWFDFRSGGGGIYKNSIDINAAMISIGVSCKYPEVAFRIIEKLHTDQEYYDLLMYGVRGINYELTDSGEVDYSVAEAHYLWGGWTGGLDADLERPVYFGNEWDQVTKEVKDLYSYYSEENGANPFSGFVFVPNKIPQVMIDLEEVKTLYLEPLEAGISHNPEVDLALAKQKLYEAGYEIYLDEVQRQLDEFYARKKVQN